MKYWLIFLSAIANLYGFTLSLQPGWNYTNIPAGLSGHKSGSFNIGLQAGFKITPVFSLHFSGIYSPRTWSDEGLGTINLPELYATYEHRFTIQQPKILPFFTIGIAGKFGFYDFTSKDKTALNLTGGHGYKIKLNPHLSIVPMLTGYLQLMPTTVFHGVISNLGIEFTI